VRLEKKRKPLSKEQSEGVERVWKPSTSPWSSRILQGRDLATLREGERLNDEIVNISFQMLSDRVGMISSTQPRIHVFSSFFMKRLYDNKKYNYDNVKKWTSRLNYDVLSCDQIFLPIHIKDHWILGKVDTLEKRIVLYDSVGGARRDAQGFVTSVKRWIAEEARRNKLQQDWFQNVSEWTEEFPTDIPRQSNQCDCGVFIIMYADYLCAGAELERSFSNEDVKHFRAHLLYDIIQYVAKQNESIQQ